LIVDRIKESFVSEEAQRDEGGTARTTEWLAGMPYVRRWEARRERRRKRREQEGERQSYYGLPVIHGPHWKWLIIFYFFLGGISSGSFIIATVANLLGRKDMQPVVRVGRYLSLAALLPCPVLLILDLGRPERFLYMLRIVKLRSPMSLGTWGLTIFGGLCGLSAVRQAAQDGLLAWLPVLPRLLMLLPARALGIAGSVFGFFVGGYTGILLALTAVPLWARNYALLGPLFLASALSTATSAITFILTLGRGTSHRTLRRLERLETITLSVELALIGAIHWRSGPVIGRPLRRGTTGWLHHAATLGGIALPLVLQRRIAGGRGTPSRLVNGVASLLVLVGGFLVRYVWVMGGRASAADPAATFEFTRRDA
jgi:formate-dependent nitrite reductase membrane component NrfD